MLQATLTPMKHLLRRITFICGIAMMLFLWSSCKSHANKKSMNMLFSNTNKTRTIFKINLGIEESDCVYIGGSGITGEEKYASVCYKKLLEIAPDTLWINLSKSKSGVAKYYAFTALFFKKNTQKNEVEKRLKEDTTTICVIKAA